MFFSLIRFGFSLISREKRRIKRRNVRAEKEGRDMREESEGMRGTMESFSGPLRAILGQFLEEMREGERAFERDDGAYALLCPSGPFLILNVVAFVFSPIHL